MNDAPISPSPTNPPPVPGAVPPPVTPRRSGRVPLILALAASVVAVVPALLGAFLMRPPGVPGDSAAEIGRMVGSVLGVFLLSLVAAVVIGGIAKLAKASFSRTFLITHTVMVLLASFLALAGSLAGIAARKAIAGAASKESISGIQDDMDLMITEMQKTPIGEKRDLQFESTEKPADEMGHLRELLRVYFNEANALQNQYLDALDAAGWNSLLDPARAAADQDFKESRLILGRTRDTVEEYREKAAALLEAMPRKIDTIPVSPAMRRGMEKGFRNGMGQSAEVQAQIWTLELEIVGHFGELVGLLEERREHWTAAEGQFTFDNDEDLDRFNAILEKVNAATTRQEEIRQEAAKRATESISDLKDDLPAK